MVRCRIALLALLSAACASEPELTPELTVQALTSSEVLIALHTYDHHYVTREASDASLSTNRTQLGAWERWVLSDLDGPPLESGDHVTLRFIDPNGTAYYIVAEFNGGGPGSV